MKLNLRKLRPNKIALTILAVIVVILIGTVFGVRQIYHQNLKSVNASQKSLVVTVPPGSSVKKIAQILKQHDLIRATWAFEWYVSSNEARDKLQAGTYSLSPSQSIPDIVNVLTQGKIATDLVTILPGQRLDQIRKALIDSGFEESAVDAALQPSMYQNHPALVDKPSEANLEGYLYPESFQKTAETKPEAIISKSLDEMQQRLTPAIRSGITKQGLTVHEGVILASIVEQEVSKPDDRSQVAQVLLKRLRQNIPLETDSTAPYGAILANQPPSLKFDSAYNTYTHGGLTPTPISNVTETSLKAVAQPATTDWLYFVSGDDGVTYFSKTLEEHRMLTEQHCTRLCQQ